MFSNTYRNNLWGCLVFFQAFYYIVKGEIWAILNTVKNCLCLFWIRIPPLCLCLLYLVNHQNPITANLGKQRTSELYFQNSVQCPQVVLRGRCCTWVLSLLVSMLRVFWAKRWEDQAGNKAAWKPGSEMARDWWQTRGTAGERPCGPDCLWWCRSLCVQGIEIHHN